MDPILSWLKRLWDVWDLRILVLLSLTLQIILFMFGNRRKYIPSLWIKIVVWSAYLMADWAATVALGKLSDAKVDLAGNNANPNNALRAIWAPFLLVHLGGPDTITAYSLEDNLLWKRHFLGLGVQVVVTVYVIFMSWRTSWFSFLSILAFVAGIVKYGERTWVLKLVSGDKSGEIVPFADSLNSDCSPRSRESKYVMVLRMAICSVKLLKECLRSYGIIFFPPAPFPLNNINDFWNVIEIEMGLMYDLLYTKASLTYTKAGCILRSISFTCTVSVLLGWLWLIFVEWKRHERYYFRVDIAITGVLLAGALALEIYAVTVLLSSDWTMFWLIKHNRSKWVIRLGKELPWFFPMLRKKKWSRMMGQFDLIGFCAKEHKLSAKLSSILGLLGIDDRFIINIHATRVGVPENLYRIILDHFYYLSDPDHALDEDLNSIMKPLGMISFEWLILHWHIATEICYHDHDLNLESNNNTSQNGIREACKILSHYMMYLLLTSSSVYMMYLLLTPWFGSKDFFKSIKSKLGNSQDVSEACKELEKQVKLTDEFGFSTSMEDTLIKARDIAKDLKELGNVERAWELLNSMWLTILWFVASKGQTNPHLQQLRQGGDLLTLLWFFLPQCPTVPGFDIDSIPTRLIEELRGITIRKDGQF